MSDKFALLEVKQVGDRTVIDFGGRDVLDQINIAACRDQIADVVKQNASKLLAFNLSGIKLIPSGMLGLLASLREMGVRVQLFDPSDDVREALEITKLNQIFEVHEGPLTC